MSAATLDATLTSQALYRFFDADGELLYVGISMNPPARWAQHRTEKPWWSEVATVQLEPFPSRQAVEGAERAAILSERPRYNIAHHPDKQPSREYRTHDGPCMGSAEIAAMFDVSRQRVYQLTSRPDFPEPMVRLKAGAVWVTADVLRWAKEKGREIHE